MITWCLEKAFHRAERRLGVSFDYLRHVARISKRAVFKFLLIMPAASHRRKCSKEMVHAARIVAARFEDCGPCVQIAVNIARQDGVATDVLQKIVDSNVTELPDDVALACRFASSVVERTGEDVALREQLRQRFSEEVIVELALAVAVARFFPTFKRGLGYAVACSLTPVNVEGT